MRRQSARKITYSDCASTSRQVVCEKGLLTRAAGSVRWRQGQSEVLAALHGPQPALLRKALADRAAVEVNMQPRFDIPGKLVASVD